MAILDDLLHFLGTHNTTLSQVIHTIIVSKPESSSAPAAEILKNEIITSAPIIIHGFKHQPVIQKIVHQIAEETYTSEIQELVDKDNGWHFGASTATAEQIQQFRLEDLGQNIKSKAPNLWRMVGGVMEGKRRREQVEDLIVEAEEDWYWQEVNRIEDENLIASGKSVSSNVSGPERVAAQIRKLAERRGAILTIVCIRY